MSKIYLFIFFRLVLIVTVLAHNALALLNLSAPGVNLGIHWFQQLVSTPAATQIV